MNDNKMLPLIVDNATNEIVTQINNISNKYNLSYFLLDIILEKISNEAKIKKEQELNLLKKKQKIEKESSDNEEN